MTSCRELGRSHESQDIHPGSFPRRAARGRALFPQREAGVTHGGAMEEDIVGFSTDVEHIRENSDEVTLTVLRSGDSQRPRSFVNLRWSGTHNGCRSSRCCVSGVVVFGPRDTRKYVPIRLPPVLTRGDEFRVTLTSPRRRPNPVYIVGSTVRVIVGPPHPLDPPPQCIPKTLAVSRTTVNGTIRVTFRAHRSLCTVGGPPVCTGSTTPSDSMEKNERGTALRGLVLRRAPGVTAVVNESLSSSSGARSSSFAWSWEIRLLRRELRILRGEVENELSIEEFESTIPHEEANIQHIACHGSVTPASRWVDMVAFVDSENRLQSVTLERFVEVMHDRALAHGIEVVFLNGCNLRGVASEIKHIRYVVFWETKVDDRAAHAFVKAFYAMLIANWNPVVAFAHGCWGAVRANLSIADPDLESTAYGGSDPGGIPGLLCNLSQGGRLGQRLPEQIPAPVPVCPLESAVLLLFCREKPQGDFLLAMCQHAQVGVRSYGEYVPSIKTVPGRATEEKELTVIELHMASTACAVILRDEICAQMATPGMVAVAFNKGEWYKSVMTRVKDSKRAETEWKVDRILHDPRMWRVKEPPPNSDDERDDDASDDERDDDAGDTEGDDARDDCSEGVASPAMLPPPARPVENHPLAPRRAYTGGEAGGEPAP